MTLDETFDTTADGDGVVGLAQQLPAWVPEVSKHVNRGTFVVHGSDASVARPTPGDANPLDVVVWFGTVAPSNRADQDAWYDRANDLWKRWDAAAGQWVVLGTTYSQVDTSAVGADQILTTGSGGGPSSVPKDTYLRGDTPDPDVMNVRANGVVGDGTDESSAIQEVIDEAEALGNGTTGYPDVVFPPPTGAGYGLGSGLTLKGPTLRGLAHPNTGVRFIWNGAAGADVATLASGVAGGFAYKMLENINFRPGANEPQTWLNLTNTNTVDIFGLLRLLQFGGCTGDAIRCGGYVNAHWEYLRFDSVAGACVRVTPRYLSSFVMEKFTVDNTSAGKLKAVLHMDASGGGLVNGGPVTLKHARVELAAAPQDPSGLIYVSHPDPAPGSAMFGFKLEDIAFQDIPGTSTMNAIYRDTTDATTRDSYQLVNFRQDGLRALRGGTWPANEPDFGLQSSYPLLSNYPLDASGVEVRPRFLTGNYGFAQYREAESQPRFAVDHEGSIALGRGASAPDSRIRKGTVPNATTYFPDGIQVGSQGTWDGSHIVLGAHHLWVDGTGDLRIKSGAPTSDTDGTVVGAQT